MSDAFWIALFAGVPPTIAAIVAAIIQMRKVDKAKKDLDDKNDVANEKLTVIHTLVNDRLTNEIRSKEAALDRIKVLVKEIDALRESILTQEKGGQ